MKMMSVDFVNSITAKVESVPSLQGQINRLDASIISQLQERLDVKREESRVFLTSLETKRKVRSVYTLPRVIFDPSNQDHLRSYKKFLETGTWGGTLFHVEYPYDTVTETVGTTFSMFALKEMLGENRA